MKTEGLHLVNVILLYNQDLKTFFLEVHVAQADRSEK